MSLVKRNPDMGLDDLASQFDSESEAERGRKKKRLDLSAKEHPGEIPPPGRSAAKDVFHDEHGRMFRHMNRLMSMNAYDRHKEMINQYYLIAPGQTKILQRDTSTDRTDYDVLRDNHKFLWDASDASSVEKSWEARLAKKYYDKLFKEYVIVDLSQYKKNRVAMRWRIEREVKDGKGQFICAAKKCEVARGLESWEVNFAYMESGSKKNALVKVRLCPDCSHKLNYGSQKRKVEKKERVAKWRKEKEREEKRRRRKEGGDEEEDDKEEKDSKDDIKKPDESEQPATKSGEGVWTAPVQAEVERTVDEDIDDFLDGLFD